MTDCDQCGQPVQEENAQSMDSLGEVRWTPETHIHVRRVQNGWIVNTTRHVVVSKPDEDEPEYKYYQDEPVIYHTLGELVQELPSMVNYLRNTEEAFDRELGWDAVTNNPDR